MFGYFVNWTPGAHLAALERRDFVWRSNVVCDFSCNDSCSLKNYLKKQDIDYSTHTNENRDSAMPYSLTIWLTATHSDDICFFNATWHRVESCAETSDFVHAQFARRTVIPNTHQNTRKTSTTTHLCKMQVSKQSHWVLPTVSGDIFIWTEDQSTVWIQL